MKKSRLLIHIAAMICIFTVLMCFTACGKKENDQNAEESTASVATTTEVNPTESSSEKEDEANEKSEVAEEEEPELIMGVVPFDFSKVDPDPSTWSMEEIVNCYKSGMAKADSADAMTDMEFQLIGDLPGAASILKKPVNLAMKLGAQPYNALTGGYWDLVPEDLQRADAHKEGKYVVINLYPKVQVDGPNGDEHEGSVGHVVNVVQGIGDFIDYVEKNYGILNAYYDDDSIVLTYKDSYAKNIRINTETGKMESGTWGYDVYIYLDHCGILGVKFNDFNTAIRWKCWYPVVD
ncbi:MAG: hypothetical protein MJ125_04290 [Clostridia bacterium]|nr:hypothetical protein [Clostridia bacterium]